MNNSEFDFETTFPQLGHPEHHFNKYPNHPWVKDLENIKLWIMEFCVVNGNEKCVESHFDNGDIIINKDLTVDFNKFIAVDVRTEEKYLPVKFKEVNVFNIPKGNLRSLIGSPYIAKKLIIIENQIESLEGLSSKIKDEIILVDNNLKSFKGMPMMENNIKLVLTDNLIYSWDEFTNCFELWISAKKDKNYNYRKELNFLIKTPVKNIAFMMVRSEFESSSEISVTNRYLDIELLAAEQYKRMAVEVDEKIKEVLEEKDLNKKKRKL